MRIPKIPYVDVADIDNLYEHPERNVARGAAWLDKEFPGWERRVDVSILDISDVNLCICGQVIPQEMIQACEARSGYFVVEGNDSRPMAHGFMDNIHADYWVALIKERFDSGTLSDA